MARQEVHRRRQAVRPRRSCTSPPEAFELVKSLANRNFDETVEVAFRLGVDPRKADQMLRGTVSLPAGTGKDVRVAVFAAGDAAQEARGGRRRRRRRRRPRRRRSRAASSTSTSRSRRPT